MDRLRLSKGGLVRVKALSVYGNGTIIPAGMIIIPVEAIHVYTPEERAALYSDPRWQGLDSSGEPMLVPGHCYVRLIEGELLHVLRARARPPFSRRGTWALVLSTRLGQDLYVRHGSLESVEGGQ